MDNRRDEQPRSRFRRLSGVLAAVVLGSASVWRVWHGAPELPVDRVSQISGWADESRCADCHEQGETFWETGHAQTLVPASDLASLALLQQWPASADRITPPLRIETEPGGVRAVHVAENSRRELPLDWCFGSGRHARTWVSLLTGSWGATDLCEFRWTWYQDIGGFDVTPGQPEEGVGGYFQPLGVLHDHPKTRKCFACHASYLPMEGGHLDESSMKPGVTCQRCHGPQGGHVASDGEFIDSTWRGDDRMELVNLCAQCHRRADEQPPDEITPQNKEIVRFQPVGLVQSPCFRESDMTCITCHNPHRTLEDQDSLGIWQCVQCHDGSTPASPLCAAGHAEDCLRCHMPRIRMDAPLHFTDHWIRVRDAEDSQP